MIFVNGTCPGQCLWRLNSFASYHMWTHTNKKICLCYYYGCNLIPFDVKIIVSSIFFCLFIIQCFIIFSFWGLKQAKWITTPICLLIRLCWIPKLLVTITLESFFRMKCFFKPPVFLCDISQRILHAFVLAS